MNKSRRGPSTDKACVHSKVQMKYPIATLVPLRVISLLLNQPGACDGVDHNLTSTVLEVVRNAEVDVLSQT
jgi:hypothetical protein